ncbi:MAG: peptidoglycan-binding protein [Brevundimonas sp.]|nr:MAG: peptidoglycan-binding protein [Brevundimonas sp.]
MNRRQLGLGAAITAIASSASVAALAQTRDPAAVAFYNGFNDQLALLPVAQQADVRAFYELNGWRPVWTAPRLQALRGGAGRAERHGLYPGDFFDFEALAADRAGGEIRTTAAALDYARVLAQGRVDPTTVEELWEMNKNVVDLPAGLNAALANNTLADWLEGLAPTDIGYSNLSAGYVRYRRLIREKNGWPAFRAGATIEPGGSDARIPALVQRLAAEGDITADTAARMSGNAYTADVQAGVRSFQARHGLGADGRIGTATQRSLSASAEDRARQIALNLERRRWLNRNVSPERIEVNTAAAIMVYWKDGRPVHSNRVVCGAPDNQTPSLEKPFASVVANPPWYVPQGIARREILPKGAGYLRSQNMYVTPEGGVVQRAGPTAALGYVKFELRDSYAIFLHDTPSKAAFNLSVRQRSHGCVRVQNAVEFARILLSPDPARLDEFDTAQETRETKRIQTGREIGVRLLYWTAFVDGQGRVAFREDVYSRDRKLAEALGIAVSLPQVVDDGRNVANDVGP